MIKTIYATQCKPSKTRNDDMAGHEGNVFWLMDGATQLEAPAHGLDASWHVNRLSEQLARLVREESTAPLAAMARQAIALVGAEFLMQTGLDGDAPQDLRPFSTLILCRIMENQLEYLVLCDSTLAVKNGSSMYIVAEDKRLDDMNSLEDAYGILGHGKGFDSPEYKAALRASYDRVQAALNNPASHEAWYAVAQDADVIKHAVIGRRMLEAGDEVLLMSDGFTRAVDTLGLYKDWNALAAGLDDKGPDALIDEVRNAEAADDQGAAHSRSSRHDDATVLWIKRRN